MVRIWPILPLRMSLSALSIAVIAELDLGDNESSITA